MKRGVDDLYWEKEVQNLRNMFKELLTYILEYIKVRENAPMPLFH